jgi:ATP-dependent helicase/nuclease subunit B
LAAILRRAGAVTLTATVNRPGSYFGQLAPYDFFFETKQTINQLTKLASENQAELLEPSFLERRGQFPAMDYFRRNFFYYGAQPFDGRAAGVRVLEAADREAEAIAAAELVTTMAREKNWRYHDIAVLTGDISSYERILRRVFATYDIPMFIDTRSDILPHPLTELIRSAVDVAVKNWSYESVFRFLRTGMAGIPIDGIDMLENYVLANGVKGWQWQREWTYGENAEEANTVKIQVIEALKPFTEGLTGQAVPIREYAVRIFNMLAGLRVTETLTKWIEELTIAEENEMVRQHSQIWGKICGLFDKLVDILGDESATTSEFAKILDAGLSSIDMGIIPPSVDQLIVGDVTRSRLADVKALVVLGANEGMLPKAVPGGSLINDAERQYLTEQGIELASDDKRKTREERFLAYTALCRPSCELVLIYSRGNNGKPLGVSPVVKKIRTMFPDLVVEDAAAPEVSPAKAMLSRIGPVIRQYLSGGELTETERTVYAQLKTNKLAAEQLGRMEAMIRQNIGRLSLSEATVRRMYGPEVVAGVSRLEQYVECPFAYFMRYDLKARERRQYSVTNLDMGTLYHNVLELFSKKLAERAWNWRELTAGQIDTLTDECVDELSPEMPAFSSTARFSYMLRRVRRICKRSIWALAEHIKRGLFEPFGAELQFSSESPLTGIELRLNGHRRLVLTGRIDRVDALDSHGKKYVKIIDYKSGNKRFNLDDVYFGTQLQLLLYMDALLKHGQELFGGAEAEILPGGVFYFNINDPIVDETGAEELDEALLKAFKMTGLALADKEVAEALDTRLPGESSLVPLSIRKTDVQFGSKSSVADESRFRQICADVERKIVNIGNQITTGDISVYPYKKAARTACDYCVYAAVCGIEADDRGGKYHLVAKAVDLANRED